LHRVTVVAWQTVPLAVRSQHWWLSLHLVHNEAAEQG